MSNYKRVIIKIALLGALGLLSACGGGGGGSSSTSTTNTNTAVPTTISGKAEAPGGVVAQLETSKPILLATMDFIFPVA